MTCAFGCWIKCLITIADAIKYLKNLVYAVEKTREAKGAVAPYSFKLVRKASFCPREIRPDYMPIKENAPISVEF
jgi:hypothetical protein